MAHSAYADRAVVIHGIARGLRRKMEMTAGVGTMADKIILIEAGVEIVNKILFSFHINQELLDSIDDTLNRFVRLLTPTPSSINRLFVRLMGIVRRLEHYAVEWVRKYVSA